MKKLTDLIESLEDENEIEIVNQAIESYQSGTTYKMTSDWKLKESLTVGYAEFKLSVYRRNVNLPKGHYLK